MWGESTHWGGPGGPVALILLFVLPPSLLLLNVVGVVISVFIRSWWFAFGVAVSILVDPIVLIVIFFRGNLALTGRVL